MWDWASWRRDWPTLLRLESVGFLSGHVLEAHSVAGQGLGRRRTGQAHDARPLPGRDRRLRHEGRLDRHGRLPRRVALGPRRGEDGHAGRSAGRRAGRARRRQPARSAHEARDIRVTDTLLEELKASQQLMVAMTQLVADDHPEFEFYSNDDRDFDGISLESALSEWAGTRNRLIDFVRALSEEERSCVGVHKKFGELTVDGYLRVALDHDRDHLRSLERLAAEASR